MTARSVTFVLGLKDTTEMHSNSTTTSGFPKKSGYLACAFQRFLISVKLLSI